MNEIKWSIVEDKLMKLGESEMEMFRFLQKRPAGAILTAETDIMLARLLAMDELVEFTAEDNKAIVPVEIREDYRNKWSDGQTLQWRKYNWMYKCLEAGKYLYGVMDMDVLGQLFALRYPHADAAEIKELFETTPVSYQWFAERDGRLVLNGFEQDNYYLRLEEMHKDIPVYIPTKDEVEELYNNGSLSSREGHKALKDHIMETFGVDENTALVKLNELYEDINNRIRMSDAVEKFAKAEGFAFASDEEEVKFIEKYIEMSRECRVRDNYGHDYYEMVGIMASLNKNDGGSMGGRMAGGSMGGRMTGGSMGGNPGKKEPVVKKPKIGRNDPCPCGSGKKYKNCCGKN